MDQLKGEMLNASTLHDICTKGIGSLTHTDQAQAQAQAQAQDELSMYLA